MVYPLNTRTQCRPLTALVREDAFSATLAVYTGEGMGPEQALRRAPINSMSVVQYVGAQKGLLTREGINRHLAEAPDTYTLQKQ